MNRIFIFLLWCMVSTHASWGQSTIHCTDYDLDSAIRQRKVDDFEVFMSKKIAQRASSRISKDRFTIPVIVHVVHDGDSVGVDENISYERILSQIQVLNEDFNRIPGSRGYNTHPRGVICDIEFVLATHDTNGAVLPEPGVDRIKPSRKGWNIFVIDASLKPATIWDPNRYFNIWVLNIDGIKSRGVLGHAQFPDLSSITGLSTYGGESVTDGIVVDYQSFGSMEKGKFTGMNSVYNLGRTTTHEVGHWLGLRHIWGDGDCSVDDYCADTPDHDSPMYGCPKDSVGCTDILMVQNFMDYTDDACMNIFTKDQKSRIDVVLVNSPRRKSLSSNLQYKSIYPTDIPDVPTDSAPTDAGSTVTGISLPSYVAVSFLAGSNYLFWSLPFVPFHAGVVFEVFDVLGNKLEVLHQGAHANSFCVKNPPPQGI